MQNSIDNEKRSASSTRTRRSLFHRRRGLLAKGPGLGLAAANADEAVQVFERDPAVDVTLTDVVMPGGSGPELTNQLVERRPTLKVIYMSGFTGKLSPIMGSLIPGRVLAQAVHV